MTKEEILSIVRQNKDLLTPENYQRILKNVDIFTDDEKIKIAHYLKMSQELIKTSEYYLKAQTALFKKTENQLKTVDGHIIQALKDLNKADEEADKTQESKEADNLFNNL